MTTEEAIDFLAEKWSRATVDISKQYYARKLKQLIKLAQRNQSLDQEQAYMNALGIEFKGDAIMQMGEFMIIRKVNGCDREYSECNLGSKSESVKKRKVNRT